MGDTVLRTEGLTKKYGKKLANNNISVEIKHGEICGFIGVNGAGKTTFMRMICGLTLASSGTFSLFDKTGKKEIERARRNMGALIEHPAFYPYLTGMQNMVVQGRNKGINPKDGMTEYKRLLDMCGLSEAIDERTGSYSMGMKQRLGLAMALIGSPEFLILDEPYVGLDPIGIHEIRELLKELNKNGLTILFSSHNLTEMSQLATRYLFIHNGKIVREVSAEVLDQETGTENLESYFINMVNRYSGEKQ